MQWLEELWLGESVAQAVLMLGFTAALGLAVGSVKVAGISLGVGGVLFAGLGMGAGHIRVNAEILEFVREFGLMLFVYAIGLQVGPGFFSSLRRQGLRLNLMAVFVIALGSLVAIGIAHLASVPMPVAVGLLAGAVTNTPSLGAAQQALADMPGIPLDAGTLVGAGYAAAYPFGILGVISTMLILKRLFRVDPMKEANEVMAAGGRDKGVAMADVEVTQPSIHGLTIQALGARFGRGVVVTRRLRNQEQVLVRPETDVALGDVLHAVGTQENLERFRAMVGKLTDVHLPELSSQIQLRRIVVTQRKVLGRSIQELQLGQDWGIVVSRVERSGLEFAPHSGVHLHFGDRLTVVGVPQSLEHAANVLGDQVQELDRPHVLPVFLGIALGVLLGSIPITLGSMPAPVRLGLAGGPLLVAIAVGRWGRLGPFLCHVPNAAKKLLAEFGICLFLACVGLKSGDRFFHLMESGSGFLWMGLAILITMVPILIVGAVGRKFMGMNYATLIGVLAGSMTDPPALAYANQISGGDAPAVSYATVYPLTMLLRVIVAQILVIQLMG